MPRPTIDKFESALLRLRLVQRDLMIGVFAGLAALTIISACCVYLLLTQSHLPAPF